MPTPVQDEALDLGCVFAIFKSLSDSGQMLSRFTGEYIWIIRQFVLLQLFQDGHSEFVPQVAIKSATENVAKEINKAMGG